MTNLITEARELCEKATPGPWEVNQLDDCFVEPRICKIPANGCYDYKMFEANSMLIAKSRTLIPELCDALEKAEEQNKQLMHEVCKLACESVERDCALARLEAEAITAWNNRTEPDNHSPTNADGFRSMTDKELAKIITSDLIGELIPFCQNKYECDAMLSINTIPEEWCMQCALDWLQQPAKEEL